MRCYSNFTEKCLELPLFTLSVVHFLFSGEPQFVDCPAQVSTICYLRCLYCSDNVAIEETCVGDNPSDASK